MLDNLKDRYIFIILKLVKRTFLRYALLDLEIIKEVDDEAIIVGLTAIYLVCLYIV